MTHRHAVSTASRRMNSVGSPVMHVEQQPLVRLGRRCAPNILPVVEVHLHRLDVDAAGPEPCELMPSENPSSG